MVRIEWQGRDGVVRALQIPAGIELGFEEDGGVEVVAVRDAAGRTLATFPWHRILSASVERAVALPPAA